jgi:hypothetical protein
MASSVGTGVEHLSVYSKVNGLSLATPDGIGRVKIMN